MHLQTHKNLAMHLLPLHSMRRSYNSMIFATQSAVPEDITIGNVWRFVSFPQMNSAEDETMNCRAYREVHVLCE